MDQHQIANAFRQLMPRISSSGNPEGELLKYASEENLSPAILAKMAQTYNTAKTLNVYDTAPEEVDRGRSFNIIDVPDLLSQYTTWRPKEAKAVKRTFDSDASGWLEDDSLHKAASQENTSFHDRVPNFTDEALGVERYEIQEPQVEKKAFAPEKTRKELLHELDILSGTITEHEYKLADLFGQYKHASLYNRRLAQELMQDMRAEYGDSVELPLTKFAKFLQSHGVEQEDPLLPDTRVLADDRHKAASWMQQVQDTVEIIQGCAALGCNMAKEANEDDFLKAMEAVSENWTTVPGTTADAIEGGSRDMSQGEPQTIEWEEREIPSRQVETVSENDKPSEREEKRKSDKSEKKERELKGPYSPTGSTKRRIDPNALAGSGLSAYISNRADRLHRNQVIEDEALEDLEGATVIQRLIHRNPVLQQYPVDDILSQYNSIRKANPHIARDKNLLVDAIMEAVEHEGIPLHTYGQLLETRNKANPPQSPAGEDKGNKINISLV